MLKKLSVTYTVLDAADIEDRMGPVELGRYKVEAEQVMSFSGRKIDDANQD